MLDHLQAEVSALELAEFYAKAAELSTADLADTLLPMTRQVIVLQQMLEHATHRADHDPLTGLGSRAAVLAALDLERRRLGRTGTPFTVLMMDLDRFKDINDRHGHVVGDRVLEAVGAAVRGQLRATDHAGRYGGEEILIILSAAVDPHAMAQRIRRAVETETRWLGFRVTCSIGAYTVGGPEAAQQILECADRALYTAKGKGRNRVYHHAEES